MRTLAYADFSFLQGHESPHLRGEFRDNKILGKGDWLRLCREILDPRNSGPVRVICEKGVYV